MILEKDPAPRTRKRQLPTEAEPAAESLLLPTAKRRKLENQKRHIPPGFFWDNLSRLWLTPRALREFDRRTIRPTAPVPPDTTGKEKINLALLKRSARQGGPELSDLRTVNQCSPFSRCSLTVCQFPESGTATPPHQTMNSSQSGSRKRVKTGRGSDTSSKTRRISAYEDNFEQHLIDHGVYPEGHGGLKNLQEPDNWEEIHARLAMRRASLSPSRFTREAFWDFKETNKAAWTESTVMSKVFPMITGKAKIPLQENLLFGNLEDLTDGSLVKAKPDFYDGTTPSELHKQVRADLTPYIVPSTHTTHPCVPNFFTEGKGSHGNSGVCELQALYDGALGARGVHKLRSYIDGETTYDNNAYTITSTYDGGTGDLTLFSVHPTPPKNSQNPIEYRMNQLRGWKMTDSQDTFRAGASALRNVREWAQDKRQELVDAANRKAKSIVPSDLDSSTHSFPSLSTDEIVPQDSDTSTDELGMDADALVSSDHRPPVGARKGPPAEISSSRRMRGSLARVSEDPMNDNSSDG